MTQHRLLAFNLFLKTIDIYCKSNSITKLELGKRAGISKTQFHRITNEEKFPTVEQAFGILKALSVPQEEQVAIYRSLFPEIYKGLGEPYLNPIKNEYAPAQYEDHIINPKYTAIMIRSSFKGGLAISRIEEEYGKVALNAAYDLVDKGILKLNDNILFGPKSDNMQLSMNAALKVSAIMSEYFDQSKFSHGLEGAMLIPARVDKECRKKVRDVLKGVKDQIHQLIEASDKRQTKKSEDITIAYSLIDLEEPRRT
jgi:transcriptional regulator with XRE-family HTH domain